MPFVETRLISPTTLTTSASSALYTVPTGYSAIIKQLVVTNITGTAATFTFYIGAASAGNALFSGTSVAANDTVIINLSQVVTTGETLRALASTGSALNLTVSGVINDGPLASTATYIADNAITSAKIADGSVTTAKIADGAIVTVDIAANAVTQAKLSTDIPLSGFRNVLINGGFDVWQRGTSFTNPASGGYTADRMFVVYDGSGATRTISQGQFDPYLSGASITATPPTGTSPNYFLRWNQSVAGTGGNYNILYANRVENVRLLAGKTMTLSFYAKAGASLTMPLIDIEQSFGTGGSPSSAVYSTAASAYAVTTSWQKFTYTFTIPSAAGKVIGTDANSSYTSIRLWVPLNTTFVLDLWGIQLETGSQATPFEQRPIGTELALCQRYYWRSTSGLTTDGNSRHSHFRRLNAYQMIASGHCAFPVPMRAEPSVSLYNGNGIGYVDAYGAGQESYVIASAEGLSAFGLGMIVKYTNSGLSTTANFSADPASYSYWMNIEASAEL